ncbi:MAG: hypothetical protein AABY15_02065 [Nanoarchaeota archaeon]
MDAEKIESEKIKTPEQVQKSRPIPPEGYWWKSFLSSVLWAASVMAPFCLLILIIIVLFFGFNPVPTFLICMMFINLVFAFIICDNVGPVFTDGLFSGLHYYKKRKLIWNRWWYETWRYKKYLENKDLYEDDED